MKNLASSVEVKQSLVSAQIKPWLQEHQEMINSSDSWMAGAQSWLAAPCTYTTAKCLSGRVHALQVGLRPRPSLRSFYG